MFDRIKAVAKLIWRWRYRSSMTGRFVPREYAEKHPDITEKERVP